MGWKGICQYCVSTFLSYLYHYCIWYHLYPTKISFTDLIFEMLCLHPNFLLLRLTLSWALYSLSCPKLLVSFYQSSWFSAKFTHACTFPSLIIAPGNHCCVLDCSSWCCMWIVLFNQNIKFPQITCNMFLRMLVVIQRQFPLLFFWILLHNVCH